MRHYLDYNATAPMRPQVAELMHRLSAQPLNPSSVHAEGREAKRIIEEARRTVAEAIGAFANEIVFTASGTEANNWALRAFLGRRVFISAVEHSSVLKAAGAALEPVIIPVMQAGVVDVAALEKLLPGSGGFLVSVMLAGNETGVIQPVREIAGLVHAQGGILHCDAVQALGKIPVDFTALGCDLMTLSAHKMGGPLGVAALIIKNNLAVVPLLLGGGQELGRRAGTENVAAIAGFAKAVELMDLKEMQLLHGWLENMEAEVGKMGGIVLGKGAPRLPNTSCIALPGMPAQTQLIRLDLEGIAVSAGSACSSGRIEPSHVLRAMGVSAELAQSAIRISGGWGTEESDIAALICALKKVSVLARAS